MRKRADLSGTQAHSRFSADSHVCTHTNSVFGCTGAAFRVEQPNIKRPWWKKLKPESLGKAKGADTTHPTLLALKSAVRKPPPATESQQNVVVVVLKKISLQDEVLYHVRHP